MPFWLVHGINDHIVDVGQSRRFDARLRRLGSPVALKEVDSDHAGFIMTEYYARRGHCTATRLAHAVAGGGLTAAVIADAAGRGSPPGR